MSAPPLLSILLPVRNAARDLPGFLDSAGRYADAVVALDDGSTDDTQAILAADPLVKVLLGNPVRIAYTGWNDAENRNATLEGAARLNPVWLLSLDADERIDEADGLALRAFLETDALPGLAYGFERFEMRGDDGSHLPDGVWQYRLFAHEPGQRFPSKRLHFAPIPRSIPRSAYVDTTFRIQHLGGATPERRLAQYEKYRQTDPDCLFWPDYTAVLDDNPSRPPIAWAARPADLPPISATGPTEPPVPETLSVVASPDHPALSVGDEDIEWIASSASSPLLDRHLVAQLTGSVVLALPCDLRPRLGALVELLAGHGERAAARPAALLRAGRWRTPMARQPDPTPPTDETVALSALTPDSRNARRHPERNLATLEASLREVGATRSIVVDEAGLVLAGNATVEAAGRAGLSRVRVVDADGTELVAVRRSGLTDEQKRRLALFDNRTAELAEWDESVLASLAEDTDLARLWEQDELASLLAGLAEEPVALVGDPDDVPEVPEVPVTQPGDLWLLGPHRLLCGDSTDPDSVRRLMAGTRAVLMPTDPPYLVDYTGGNHPQSWSNTPAVKDKHWDSYREGDGAAFFTQFLRVALAQALVPNPALYQFHAARRQALVEAAWRENGLVVHQTVIWVKARPVLTRSDYIWQHEPCFYGWVEGRRPSKRPPANATTVWAVDQVGESDGVHPTQKPVELVRRMVEHHTETGEAVYEPFAGSGTAVAACELTGRVCYALELSPAFCDVIVERWERLTGKTATREPQPQDDITLEEDAA